MLGARAQALRAGKYLEIDVIFISSDALNPFATVRRKCNKPSTKTSSLQTMIDAFKWKKHIL